MKWVRAVGRVGCRPRYSPLPPLPSSLSCPPLAGTGKTVTLVECALQLLARYPEARLLCCAPVGYSADLLCSALAAAGMDPQDLLRLNDPRRPVVTVRWRRVVPPALLRCVSLPPPLPSPSPPHPRPQAKADTLPYCPLNEAARMFTLPTPERVASARVVVATCCAAGLLREGAFEEHPPKFTHVLVDEAGQARSAGCGELPPWLLQLHPPNPPRPPTHRRRCCPKRSSPSRC